MRGILPLIAALAAYGIAGFAVQAGLSGGNMAWLYFVVAMVWAGTARDIITGGGR